MQSDDIAADFLSMAAEDEHVRSRLAAAGALFDGYHPEMRAVHRRNGDRLARVLDLLGTWPGIGLVGEDAAKAAWIIAQHDIANPPLMRRCLDLLRSAAEAGEAKHAWVATMEDRVRAFEGRMQLYGTQLDIDEAGTLSPWPPIEDIEGLDERRRAAGLRRLKDHISSVRSRDSRADQLSAEDILERRSRADEFARSVGWR